MANKAGIWIDHRKAIIVHYEENETVLQIVNSGIAGRPHPRGGAPSSTPYGFQDAVADNKLERKYKLQLRRYYDNVLSHMSEAEAVFIFGPGEAKVEFRKHILHNAPHLKILGVEVADKMTENQIAAKVRDLFKEQEKQV